LVLAFAGIPAAFADDPGQRDIIRVREGTKEEPWLRIDSGGHTAAVRALAFTSDSSRLLSGGLDKNVEVWNMAALRDLRRVFLRERTIRWQVARGMRGSIYALATAPDAPLVAIGGYGAMGSLGEIVLVNPVDGKLIKVLEGHRQTICSLAFSPDGKWLASMDTAGETRLWNRGDWSSRMLYEQDAKTFGTETAAVIAKQIKLRPLAFRDDNHVVVPAFVSRPGESRLRWQLVEINPRDSMDFHTLDTVHYGAVTALAASRDGKWLASADAEGKLYLYDRAGGGPPRTLATDRGVSSLCFSPDGHSLVAGTLVGGSDGKGQVQVWNTDGTIARRVALPDHVYACAISPDGNRLAYSGGEQGQVFVESVGGDVKPAILQGTGRRIGKVAFAVEQPYYRVAFGNTSPARGFNDSGDLQETFDTTNLSHGTEQPKPSDWIPTDWLSGGWTAKRQSDGTLQLYFNGAPQGMVNVSGTLRVPNTLDEGTPQCYCWVPDASGKPFAIAIGTDVQDSIYVCRLEARGVCPILRHFRGHNDRVTSLGISRDLKYLVSGSADGTVRFWNLAELAQAAAPAGRWGATFAVQGGKLVAADVHPAGPLYGKGMRKGDVVTATRWPADRAEQSERDPAAMLEQLQKLPWGTQVVFEYARNGAAQPAFQLLPAWQPLATLFVAANGEWAFWTPAGYYDASMNGYRMFGWQVNRGLQRLPDFYRADQFYKELERPRVMERLLPSGSLREALDQAAENKPEAQANGLAKLPQHEVLPAQIAATPRIEILEPAAGAVLRDRTTKVKARVELPQGRKMLQVQVFANGVSGTKRELLAERPIKGGDGGSTEQIYQWDLALPTEPKDLIEVVAGTDAPTAAFGDVVVERSLPAERPRPEMYVLCLGINRYGDPKINQLGFPVADAQAIADVFRGGAAALYHVNDVKVLTNEEVTPTAWKKSLADLRSRLKDRAQPDDLVVFFLAGHGIVDEATQKYYYVGHDFTLADLDRKNYKDCLCWDDFAALADVPCRKLVLLDTCHSGALQPLRSRDLKAAVRELQADVIFSVTASTGEQRAAEKAEWHHGAFTRCLLEALGGGADQSRDGIVRLDEVVPYVKDAVEKLTSGHQTPTAAPDAILPFTAIPMTRKR
jgi:WD40 repeat protein